MKMGMFVVSLVLVVVGFGFNQAAGGKNEPPAARKESPAGRVGTIDASGKPVIRLATQDGSFRQVEIFPAGFGIQSGDAVQSDVFSVGGAARIVIRMVADAPAGTLEWMGFWGRSRSGQLISIEAAGEAGNFGVPFGAVSIELPVRGEMVAVQLRNSGFNTRFLNPGAYLYAGPNFVA